MDFLNVNLLQIVNVLSSQNNECALSTMTNYLSSNCFLNNLYPCDEEGLPSCCVRADGTFIRFSLGVSSQVADILVLMLGSKQRSQLHLKYPARMLIFVLIGIISL